MTTAVRDKIYEYMRGHGSGPLDKMQADSVTTAAGLVIWAFEPVMKLDFTDFQRFLDNAFPDQEHKISSDMNLKRYVPNAFRLVVTVAKDQKRKPLCATWAVHLAMAIVFFGLALTFSRRWRKL